jgi:hypothetical protein
VSVALVIQHAMRKRCAMFSSLVCPAVSYYYLFSHKRQDIRGKKMQSVAVIKTNKVIMYREIITPSSDSHRNKAIRSVEQGKGKAVPLQA